MTAASEHTFRGCLDARPKHLMDAVARHDIGLAAQNARRVFPRVERPELSVLAVELQVDAGVGTRPGAAIPP
jgi:hypothetical protein